MSGVSRTLLVVGVLLGCGSGPPRACEPAVDETGLATLCGFAKPEDVEAVPGRDLVLVSEMGWEAPSRGGSLSALVLEEGAIAAPAIRLWPPREAGAARPLPTGGDPGCAPPDAEGFSPHGLSVSPAREGSVRVAVVAHGAREAIELFDLDGVGHAARLGWRGCVPLPPDTAGNDVVFHPDGRLFVTNYIPTVHGLGALLALRRGYRGEVTGDVLVWSRESGWRHLSGTEAAIPNGLVLSPDGRFLFVAENGAGRIARYAVDGGVSDRRERPLDGAPDNLRWSARGSVLAAVMDARVAGAWRLVEIDADTLETRSVFEHTGALIRSVTSVTEAGRGIVFGTYLEDRLALLPRGKIFGDP